MSASKRKPTRLPGRKSGAKIRNGLALKPLGMKATTTFELDAYAALQALQCDVTNQDHLVSLYVLADLAERIGGEDHIRTHAASIKRMCDQIHDNGYRCGVLTYHAMSASADVLIRWIKTQRNHAIASNALTAIKELTV